MTLEIFGVVEERVSHEIWHCVPIKRNKGTWVNGGIPEEEFLNMTPSCVLFLFWETLKEVKVLDTADCEGSP